MSGLSHVDKSNRPTMVDVSKQNTERSGGTRAGQSWSFRRTSHERFSGGDIETAKGPVFVTAIIAGVMAAKRTHELIPFCHPLGLDKCKITIELDRQKRAVIDCQCKVHHRTGVEMEALTGASVAALTIYDMCKALSHEIVISETRLISKTGGKEDYFRDSA